MLRSGGLEADGDAAKQCVVRACCGKGDADACGGLGDACGDFEEAHSQGGELGVGERMRLGDGVAHRQHQPVGGGMQHETHLIGECRATTGPIGGKLALVLVWTAPDGIDRARLRPLLISDKGTSVEQVIRIGMDTSKHIFQLHGVNAAEVPVLRKKLRRKEMMTFFERLVPTVIAIEACGASHHWARLLQSLGHSVKLIPPQLVKPYVKRSKNDAADAEALCEAMSRPTMRFVPVKTAERQAALMLVRLRDRLIRNRTQLANAIRGYAAEFGLTAAKGMTHLIPLLERAQVDDSLPMLARELFAIQAKDYAQLQTQIDEVDTKLMAWHRADECSRRLAKIPGIGPISAALLTMKTPDPKLFRSGRQFAAWIGLTPKDHSTAGKVRLGVITRAGDEGLRSVLVVGATSVILQVRRGRRASPWLAELLKRKAPKLAAVALANKMARIAWKLMFTGETYIAGSAFAPLAGAS